MKGELTALQTAVLEQLEDGLDWKTKPLLRGLVDDLQRESTWTIHTTTDASHLDKPVPDGQVFLSSLPADVQKLRLDLNAKIDENLGLQRRLNVLRKQHDFAVEDVAKCVSTLRSVLNDAEREWDLHQGIMEFARRFNLVAKAAKEAAEEIEKLKAQLEATLLSVPAEIPKEDEEGEWLTRLPKAAETLTPTQLFRDPSPWADVTIGKEEHFESRFAELTHPDFEDEEAEKAPIEAPVEQEQRPAVKVTHLEEVPEPKPDVPAGKRLPPSPSSREPAPIAADTYSELVRSAVVLLTNGIPINWRNIRVSHGVSEIDFQDIQAQAERDARQVANLPGEQRAGALAVIAGRGTQIEEPAEPKPEAPPKKPKPKPKPKPEPVVITKHTSPASLRRHRRNS